jgi:hypothetical protein
VSSDPTRPNPEWWKAQAPQAPQAPQDPQDPQAPQVPQVPQAPQAPQAPQGYQGYQGPQGTQGLPVTQGYPTGQGYPTDQGYPTGQGYPVAQDYQGPAPRVRRRRRKWPLITLIVIIVILVVGDRAANAYTENQMASQFQSSLELSGKPHVTIQGFPFLTQLAARDLHTVDVNASNETAGPGGQLEIASLTATLNGMHIHGLNSVTIDQFNASALITFTALANAGGIPQGITLSAAGPNQIKANIDILGFSSSATAQVTQTGNSKINVKVTQFGGVPADVLGNAADFTITIPKLPAGVAIQSVSVTQQGLRIVITGHNTTLSQ